MHTKENWLLFPASRCMCGKRQHTALIVARLAVIQEQISWRTIMSKCNLSQIACWNWKVRNVQCRLRNLKGNEHNFFLVFFLLFLLSLHAVVFFSTFVVNKLIHNINTQLTRVVWTSLHLSSRLLSSQPRTNLSNSDSPSLTSGTSSIGSMDSPLPSSITPFTLLFQDLNLPFLKILTGTVAFLFSSGLTPRIPRTGYRYF